MTNTTHNTLKLKQYFLYEFFNTFFCQEVGYKVQAKWLLFDCKMSNYDDRIPIF